jgi:hypothetical protein
MSSLNTQCLHESGNIVGEIRGGVGSVRFVTLACPAKIERDAGEMLGIFGNLKRVASIVGRQIGNQNQWIAAPLLLVM